MKKAIHEATVLLRDLSGVSAEPFHARAEAISPPAFIAIKRISGTLAEAGASARIVDDEQELSLTSERIATHQARLNDVEVVETSEEHEGAFYLASFRTVKNTNSGLDRRRMWPVSEDLDSRYSPILAEWF